MESLLNLSEILFTIFSISFMVVGVKKIDIGLEVILVDLPLYVLLKLLFRSASIVIKYLLTLFKFSESDLLLLILKHFLFVFLIRLF